MNAVCEPGNDYSDREILICKIICNSSNPIRFSDLKRKTGLHQEILTRILRRNIDRCNYKKTESGYYCFTCR